MNLKKVLSEYYINLLAKKGVIIEDKELSEKEIDDFFHNVAFNKFDLTIKQQEDICDSICDYKEKNST